MSVGRLAFRLAKRLLFLAKRVERTNFLFKEEGKKNILFNREIREFYLYQGKKGNNVDPFRNILFR